MRLLRFARNDGDLMTVILDGILNEIASVALLPRNDSDFRNFRRNFRNDGILDGILKFPKIRHCERSEAISGNSRFFREF